MTYTIPQNCDSCGVCLPKCPTGAIQTDKNHKYWIEPGLCNECEDENGEPLCVISCPDSYPLPLPTKKGRYKAEPIVLTTHSLFANGHHNPMSSSMVIWEACNILAKGKIFPWQTNNDGKLHFERAVKQGKGKIEFQLTDDISSDTPETLYSKDAVSTIEQMDIRAACMHLIFSASVTALERPWEEEFVLDNKQLETYLGLNKRKDLSKAAKLSLIKALVQQPCQLIATIDWFQQGKIKSFSVPQDRLWHLVAIENHFQEDDQGYEHLVAMTFRLKAGMWARYFLNKQGYKKHVAYYQYGSLPKFLLTTVMTIWHQHEGAVRIMLWLLFKSKMGKQQRITIPKLMYIAYGQDKVNEASLDREKRKRMLRKFESDLEVLHRYQIKPIFDPVTYPTKIQPLWARLADIPEDGDEAIEFWINDASNENSITAPAPRGKWNLLMNARILKFELPTEWDQQLSHWEKKKEQKTRHRNQTTKSSHLDLTAEQISSSRKRLGISQRQLAQLLEKSQSWIRDLEKGRFSAKPKDCSKLMEVLQIELDCQQV